MTGWSLTIAMKKSSNFRDPLSEAEIRELLVYARQSHSAANIPRKGAVLATRNTQRKLNEQYRPLRNLALVDLLFVTGLRVGEVSKLNLEDFCASESVFRVNGKGGRTVWHFWRVSKVAAYKKSISNCVLVSPLLFVTQWRRYSCGPGIPGTCVNRNNTTIHTHHEGPSGLGSLRTSSFPGASVMHARKGVQLRGFLFR